MRFLGIILLSLAGAVATHAQFASGNLAILRVGDGSSALVNTGNPFFIDQYTLGGSFVNAVTVPSTGAGALTLNGAATAEGALSRSADGQFLSFAAYNRALGNSGSVSASTVPRVIGQVDYNGNYSAGATAATEYSGMSFRSGISDGNNNYWGLGNGVTNSYFGNNGPFAALESGSSVHTVNRVLNIFGGVLYFSFGSSTVPPGQGIYSYGGLPTSTTSVSPLIATGGSPYDFALNANLTLAYIADDRSIATGGGIQKWTFDGSVWSLAYTLGTGSGSTVGARGLAVDFGGANPVIFATTAEGSLNRLITITDTGAGSSATTLATASANTIFRGLDFAPAQVPEPSCLALLWAGAAGFLALRRKN